MIVAKVGGSLFNLPHLGLALARWAAGQSAPVLFVPGGGAFADVIRQADKVHRIGEEAAHWLAIRTLSVTARLLLHLLPGAELIAGPTRGELAQKRWGEPGHTFVLDCFEFFQRHDTVPHTWDVTTDSLALAAALHLDADRLVLLKSIDVEDVPWVVAAARGWVDRYFPTLAEKAEFPVTAVNLRALAEEWFGPLSPLAGDQLE